MVGGMLCVTLTNRSGGPLEEGIILTDDGTNPLSVMASTVANQGRIVGVTAAPSSADGDPVLVAVDGLATVMMESTNAVDIGNYVHMSATAGEGQAAINLAAGRFGIAMSVKDAGVRATIKIIFIRAEVF